MALPGSVACCFRLDHCRLANAQGSEVFSRQQPDGDAGDTPGVAAAPVAGAMVPGVAKFIVMLSIQPDIFGVGATIIGGSAVADVQLLVEHLVQLALLRVEG
jgi:hypothetical protein